MDFIIVTWFFYVVNMPLPLLSSYVEVIADPDDRGNSPTPPPVSPLSQPGTYAEFTQFCVIMGKIDGLVGSDSIG